MEEAKDAPERTARCGCGNLTVTTSAEPLEVSACSCLDCQRQTGSAFAYVAVYPEAAVSIAGKRTVWKRQPESGRWLETDFCPTCGVAVCFRMEVWPETIAVSVGCFADSDFAKPETLFWASRAHRWLSFPEDVELMDTEPD